MGRARTGRGCTGRGPAGRDIAGTVVFALAAVLFALGFAVSGTPAAQAGTGMISSQPALRCSDNLTSGAASQGLDPVLLVHGTSMTVETAWAWTYIPEFTKENRPWCAIELPNSGLGDMREAGAMVADAIVGMHAVSHRKIDVVGHSQGGMLPRWALKNRPETRDMVDDLVGITPDNQGTLFASLSCTVNPPCDPAADQQQVNSPFLRELNSGEWNFPGISYTVIASRVDEIVVPFTNSFLPTSPRDAGNVRNILLQDHCPLSPTEHLGALMSGPVFEIVRDALDTPGPSRYRAAGAPPDSGAALPAGVCGTLMPGVDRNALPQNLLGLGKQLISTM